MAKARHPAHFLRRRVGSSGAQRSAAWGALLANFFAIVCLAVLVVAQPLRSIAILLTAVAFLAGFFTALTTRGAQRVTTTVVTVVVGIALVAAILFWTPRESGPGVLGVVTLLLFALGGLLARIALVIPPPSGPGLFNVARADRVVRRPVVIVNMTSGGGKAQLYDLPGACKDLDIEAVLLEPGADLSELARDAVSRGADALGMAGGDGSLAFVAQVAVDNDLPFVCIPAGTRNHFALDVGLDRADPGQALSSFLNGEEHRIDYATVNGRMFLNNVSLGVYAAIIEQDAYRDAKLETVLQMLPELMERGGPWFDLHFDVPDHGRLEQAALLQVSNNPYDTSSGIGRRGRLDSGQLGILTADPQRAGDLVGITLLAAAGRAEHAAALWAWDSPTLHVESGEETLSAGVDGETVCLDTPLDFASVRGGLRILVPPGTRVGLAEQNLGTKGTYSGLLDVALGRPSADHQPRPSSASPQ